MKRLTIRARLTLVHGGLLLLAGVVLLAVTYVLVNQRMREPLTGVKAQIIEKPLGKLPGLGAADQLRILIQEAQDEAKRNALESLLTQGGIALLLISAVALAFGWLIAGRALQPLQQITGTAQRIAAGTAGRGLHERIALDGPRDEVKELADTFDLMLERLDRSFDGQRRFVANASHELRTPLALNRSLLEVAVSRPGASAELRQLGETLLAINERHERLIDGLLTLADSEQQVVDRTPVDLAEIAGHLLDQAAAGTPELTVRRHLAPAPTAGDPVLLERLAQNLVENAVRHNLPAGGEVEVSTGTVDGRATLVVANTGPAVPSYDLETIFQPFRRLRQDRVAGPAGRGHDRAGAGRGFGLGLSIVRAVAQAHGGAVHAQPRNGGGLIVTVTMPALNVVVPGQPARALPTAPAGQLV
ncbi:MULTISPECIES: HAMP domain-containing sensor histidine kinase [Micromonospora]|uniref:histidine kinase n=1 Tax=Micromonospora solifontis TaxID=2487138 RepID=A0ABX9WCQ4_9ACTN|nr:MULTISPECIES: HAMP domain-containing sensor histidine kinase [Micromonospora]NES15211.1 HAMP domain-containing histidine kinase [Micromonospora sp. PPF5-17B]NES38123.1 HAMP domain-containing histidine kinase [Micromonospora solifontis]NES56546.1 HAMP domain-containing histidine kinase [Micromonospora sp. PPF5-6]RNL96983.1 sensor histidine kinase [Micromonospora solifontis]